MFWGEEQEFRCQIRLAHFLLKTNFSFHAGVELEICTDELVKISKHRFIETQEEIYKFATEGSISGPRVPQVLRSRLRPSETMMACGRLSTIVQTLTLLCFTFNGYVAQVLTPPYFNLAYGRPIVATGKRLTGALSLEKF